MAVVKSRANRGTGGKTRWVLAEDIIVRLVELRKRHTFWTRSKWSYYWSRPLLCPAYGKIFCFGQPKTGTLSTWQCKTQVFMVHPNSNCRSDQSRNSSVRRQKVGSIAFILKVRHLDIRILPDRIHWSAGGSTWFWLGVLRKNAHMRLRVGPKISVNELSFFIFSSLSCVIA